MQLSALFFNIKRDFINSWIYCWTRKKKFKSTS